MSASTGCPMQKSTDCCVRGARLAINVLGTCPRGRHALRVVRNPPLTGLSKDPERFLVHARGARAATAATIAGDRPTTEFGVVLFISCFRRVLAGSSVIARSTPQREPRPAEARFAPRR